MIRVLNYFLNFSALEAFGTDINSFDCATHDDLYPLEIGMPLPLR